MPIASNSPPAARLRKSAAGIVLADAKHNPLEEATVALSRIGEPDDARFHWEPLMVRMEMTD